MSTDGSLSTCDATLTKAHVNCEPTNGQKRLWAGCNHENCEDNVGSSSDFTQIRLKNNPVANSPEKVSKFDQSSDDDSAYDEQAELDEQHEARKYRKEAAEFARRVRQRIDDLPIPAMLKVFLSSIPDTE